ncbi:MAG: cyclophilin-like fold protein [Candidatus Omnitrophica bacterium]|nr:cyclophilin-like fold protein [Candidatus Omnitrophota bacterium]
MKVKFVTSKVTIEGRLNNSQIAKKIYESLPFEAKVNTWGKEIYFKIPLKLKLENPTTEVEIGDIAYWQEGSCLCIFFGPTPISINDKPLPASEVEIVGEITGDLSELENIQTADKINVLPL